MVTSTEDRLRCENIGSVFYSSIKPYVSSWTSCQFYSSCQERDYHLNGDPFFGMLSKSMHQIAQIRFENCKVFIAFEGAHPPQIPPFQTTQPATPCGPHVGWRWAWGGPHVGWRWVRSGPHMGCPAGTHMGPSKFCPVVRTGTHVGKVGPMWDQHGRPAWTQCCGPTWGSPWWAPCGSNTGPIWGW